MEQGSEKKLVLKLSEVGIDDVSFVGGKNASLGEMIRELGQKGVRVPGGFVVTAEAYRVFLRETGLEQFIRDNLANLDTTDLPDLAARALAIRTKMQEAAFSPALLSDISRMYADMETEYGKNIDVAVRSSATAEDLPGASFAGEHETYLGIRGLEDVTKAIRFAMASLFTDRAISYRVDKKFDHFSVALSVAVERMVRSDKGCSGVMFTIDTESGFRDVVLINGAWGLGEMIVQGEVIPDEFLVWKSGLGKVAKPIISKKRGEKESKMIYDEAVHGIRPVAIVKTTEEERGSFVLSDEEIQLLASWGKTIEEHYTEKRGAWTPMDMEWAKDGQTNELFIVQARPETVQVNRDITKIKEYVLKGQGELLVKGISVGSKIASGIARVIRDVKNITEFKEGEVLVTEMTDPDWEPIMKIASAIITDKGGRTSHAAIVSRELGISAVVGSGNATAKIQTGDMVTVDTTGADGLIYKGQIPFEIHEHDVSKIPTTRTKIMVNIATPDTAFEKSFLPAGGVGLAREEFIIASDIGVHPNALLAYDEQDEETKQKINKKTAGWDDRVAFYVDNLAYGIAKIGLAFYPKPVIVRFSDFKTNEYRGLIGGDKYEPKEENPMIGWRGASRYYDPKFSEAFKLECRAIKKVRDEMGLTNIIPMVPFCRTPEEGEKTLAIMNEAGLPTHSTLAKEGKDATGAVPVYVMCEIPSNVILADKFLDLFDGMSIGSNDLTQLVLGLDRDSGIVSHVANENNPAVKAMVSDIIKKCKERGKYIGICGQAPSDHPDFATFLVEQGIESISLNPDTVVPTTLAIAETEKNTTHN